MCVGYLTSVTSGSVAGKRGVAVEDHRCIIIRTNATCEWEIGVDDVLSLQKYTEAFRSGPLLPVVQCTSTQLGSSYEYQGCTDVWPN